LPPTITLGQSPVLTLQSFEQARDTAWLLRALHGLTTEIRKLR
jgi:hypothetical protein